MKTSVLFLTLGIGLVLSQSATANQACEPTCGGDYGDCHKCGGTMSCKVVPEIREIKKTLWVVRCEPFCAPLPNCKHRGDCGSNGGGACTAGCDSDCEAASCETGCKCGHCDPCQVLLAQEHIPPKCGCIRYKKVLERKEVICKVPSYKCVVVCNACCGSECNDAGCLTPAEMAVPTAPDTTPAKAPTPVPPPNPAPAPKTAMTVPAPRAVVGAAYVK